MAEHNEDEMQMNTRVCGAILQRQVWYMVGVVVYTNKWL